MNKMIIEFDKDGLKYSIEEPIALEVIYQILLNTCVATTNAVVNQGLETDPEFNEPEFRHAIFDKLNQAFTGILGHIDPTGTRNANLTEVAILLAENELLRRADAMNISVEEYLPIAQKENEKELKIWRMNQEAERKHKQKLNREAKPNRALKVLEGGRR